MLSLSLPIRAINALTISTKTCFNSTTKCLTLGAGDQNCRYKSDKTLKMLESRLGIPERPKKPLSAYYRYMQEIRPSMVNVVPKLSANDLYRAMYARWQSLDEQKKAAHQDAYKKDQIEYMNKCAVYDSTLTEDQKKELKQVKRDIRKRRQRMREVGAQRKRILDLGRPTKGSSAYFTFVHDHMEQVPRVAGTTYHEWQSLMAKRWASTSDEVKERYITEWRVRDAKFKDELKMWEEKMIRAGHLDVVRHKKLLDPPPSKPRLIKHRKPQEPAATEGGTGAVVD